MSDTESPSHLLEFEYRTESTQDAIDKIVAINQSNRSNRSHQSINQIDISSLAPSVSPNIDIAKFPPRKRPRQSSLPSLSSPSPDQSHRSVDQSAKRQSVRSHSYTSNSQSLNPRSSALRSKDRETRRSLLEAIAQPLKSVDQTDNQLSNQSFHQSSNQISNQNSNQSHNQSSNQISHQSNPSNCEIENTVNHSIVPVTRTVTKIDIHDPAPIVQMPQAVDPFSSAYINRCINSSSSSSSNPSSSQQRVSNNAQPTPIQYVPSQTSIQYTSSQHTPNQPVRALTGQSPQSTVQPVRVMASESVPQPTIQPVRVLTSQSVTHQIIQPVRPSATPSYPPTGHISNQPVTNLNSQSSASINPPYSLVGQPTPQTTNHQTVPPVKQANAVKHNMAMDLFEGIDLDVDFDEPICIKQSWSNSLPNQSVIRSTYQPFSSSYNPPVKHEHSVKQEYVKHEFIKQESHGTASVQLSNQTSKQLVVDSPVAPPVNPPSRAANVNIHQPTINNSNPVSRDRPYLSVSANADAQRQNLVASSIISSINRSHSPHCAHVNGMSTMQTSLYPNQQSANNSNHSATAGGRSTPPPQLARHSGAPPPFNHQATAQHPPPRHSTGLPNQALPPTYPAVKAEPQSNSQSSPKSRYFDDDDDDELMILSQAVRVFEENRQPTTPSISSSNNQNQSIHSNRDAASRLNLPGNQSGSYCSNQSVGQSINRTSVYNVSIDPPGPIPIPFDQTTYRSPNPLIKSPARKTQSFNEQMFKNHVNQSIDPPMSPFGSQIPVNAASMCFRGVLTVIHRHQSINQVVCVIAAEVLDALDSRTVNMLLKEESEQPREYRLIRLLDDWVGMPIQTGMTVHVIGKFEPVSQSTDRSIHQRSFSLQEPVTSQTIHQSVSQFNIQYECVISQSANLLIIEPDWLISPSTIVDSLQCVRRGLISERGKSFGFNVAATRGSIAHEITENLIETISQLKRSNQSYQFEQLFNQSIDQSMRRHLADLYACNDTEEACRTHLRTLAPSTEAFLKLFDHSVNQSVMHNLNNQTSTKHDLHEIEEQIWSPLYGLKGKIDLSVSAAALSSCNQPASQSKNQSVNLSSDQGWTKKKRLMPVELKTGYADVKHRAQVILYTLLMAERYAVKIDQGILMYLSNNQSNNRSTYQPKTPSAFELTVIPVIGSEVRSLIVRRNEIACYLCLQSINQSASSPQHQSTLLTLPPISQTQESECKRCFSRQICTLLQAVSSLNVSNNSSIDSTIDQMYPSLRPLVSHLKREDLMYVRGWVSAVEAEWDQCERDRRQLWLQPINESIGKGTCIDGLTILDAKKSANNHSTVRFKRTDLGDTSSFNNMFGLIVGDSVIVSSEKRSLSDSTIPTPSSTPCASYNQTPATPNLSTCHSHFGVACGTILQLTQEEIVVQLRSIPLIIRPFLSCEPTTSQRAGHSSQVSNQSRRACAARRVFRLDREETVSGHRTLVASIINLFTEPLEHVKPINQQSANQPVKLPAEATDAELKLQIYNQTYHRNRRHLRDLLVGRIKPTFGSFTSAVELNDQSIGLLTRLHIPIKTSINQSINDIRAAEYMRRFAQFRDLSLSQQECVQKCLKANQFALVHGYPGSGKSTTIACLIALLLSCQQRVLIACSTHNAVDHLMEKVIQCEPPFDRSMHNYQSVEHRRYARIGSRDRINPSLHFAIVDASSCATLSALEERIDGSRLIGCTLSSSMNPLLSRGLFDYCIIDEAALSTEPGCIATLQRATKFLLIGDPCQLPPVVKSSRARQQGLDKSLFHRLALAHPSAVIKLNEQYRMNATICVLASELSYQGTLRCADEDTANQQLILPIINDPSLLFLAALFAPNSSVVWFDTGAMNGLDMDVDVVAVISCLVSRVLLTSGGVCANDCVVLSPYHAHLNLLSSLLPGSLESSTIDRYQGREARCVVLSCGAGRRRSSKQETAGARMNVAVTRAKQKLVIVGCEEELGNELAKLASSYRRHIDEKELMQIDGIHDLLAQARRKKERTYGNEKDGVGRKLEW